MNHHESTRIQILDVRDEEYPATRSIGVIRSHVQEVAAIGRRQGAEAMLVCPAPEQFIDEGIHVVIAARFREAVDEDDLLLRHNTLADEFHHALKVEAVVMDLDRPLDRLLNTIGPLLTVPYRDELGRRDSIGSHPRD
jgi:hypothetical protein